MARTGNLKKAGSKISAAPKPVAQSAPVAPVVKPAKAAVKHTTKVEAPKVVEKDQFQKLLDADLKAEAKEEKTE